MTRKPNFWKCIAGVVVLAMLFVGTWGATSARLSSAKIAPGSPEKLPPRATNPSTASVKTPSVPVDPSVDVTSVFELDGNATDSPAGSPDDWSTLEGGNGTAGFLAKTTGTAANGVAIADLAGATTFEGGGSKDDLDVPNWLYGAGSSPPKDEITNAYAALYFKDAGLGAGPETILVFGADRFAQNGAAQIGFWFFQKDVHPAPGSNTFTNEHTNGDILILSDFTVGGAITTIRVFRWNSPGGSINGTLDQIGVGVDCAAPGSPKFFCGEVNSANAASPWNYTPKSGSANTFPAGGFYEGAINLSALGIADVCFAAFLAETRTSPSVDATLKDFVQGSFPQKPSVQGTGTALTCANPTGQISAIATPGTATLSWTGPGGFTAQGSPVQVSMPGDYFVTATSGGGCASDPVKVVVTGNFISPNVDAGPDKELTCSITSVQLSGSSSTPGATFSWVASGGGNIVSGANTATPTVNAAGTYTLTTTDPVNGCTSVDVALVTVDNSPPTVSVAKTAKNSSSNPQTVTATATASSNANPAGSLSYQWQSCVANCGNNASWSNLSGQTGSSTVFSNFGAATAETILFNIGSGNGLGAYEAQLFVVNLRVIVTDAGNGCSTTSGPVAVKRVVGVDP
ncbi:MAG TPA: hypothetical protein VFR78_04415 [Pyrinomonadaceae bacterium]|nr:hypothetical protein [Pyrinomonadaceae bacterium]